MLIVAHTSREVVLHLWESLNAKTMEWAGAVLTVGLGYTTLQPPGWTQLSPSAQMFEAVVGAETAALLLMVAGICRLLLLAVNGAWHSSPYPRAMAAGCTSLFWVLLFFGFYTATGFVSFGSWVYLTLAIGEFVNVTRSSRDAAASVFIRSGKLYRREDGALVVAARA